jgi:hypothetical protein
MKHQVIGAERAADLDLSLALGGASFVAHDPIKLLQSMKIKTVATLYP